jgi:hypothetical protein
LKSRAEANFQSFDLAAQINDWATSKGSTRDSGAQARIRAARRHRGERPLGKPEKRCVNFGAVAARHLDVEMWDVAWKTCSIWTTEWCHAIGKAFSRFIDDAKIFNNKLREWENYHSYRRPHGGLHARHLTNDSPDNPDPGLTDERQSHICRGGDVLRQDMRMGGIGRRSSTGFPHGRCRAWSCTI